MSCQGFNLNATGTQQGNRLWHFLAEGETADNIHFATVNRERRKVDSRFSRANPKLCFVEFSFQQFFRGASPDALMSISTVGGTLAPKLCLRYSSHIG
ncbi:MAG: hypothetical protein ACK40X_13875, partial [Armatimonadota bacterium]